MDVILISAIIGPIIVGLLALVAHYNRLNHDLSLKNTQLEGHIKLHEKEIEKLTAENIEFRTQIEQYKKRKVLLYWE